MEALFMSVLFPTETSLLLVVGGICVGVFAVLVGGAGFLSTPLIQVLFPTLPLGAIVGNTRVGSVFRGLGSTLTTHHLISYTKTLSVITFALVGTVCGALLVTKLDQRFLLIVLVIAIGVSEYAPVLARHITKRTFGIATFLTGAYMGLFGAGSGVLLVALFRLRLPADVAIAHIKAQANFAEFVLGICAVAIYLFSGSLIASIWVPWSLGALIGGLIGGWLLHHVSGLSGRTQKIFLRLSFAIALLVAISTFFTS